MALNLSLDRIAFRQEGDAYHWNVAAGLLQAWLRFSALNRITHDLESVSKWRGKEEDIGGLLLGKSSEAAGHHVVSVEGVDTYCSSSLHHVLGVRKERRSPAGTAVVGYYRIDEGRGGLTEQDMVLMRERFADPAMIALVIRRSGDALASAALCFWRAKHLESALVEFPVLKEQGPVAPATPRELSAPAPARTFVLRKAAAILVCLAVFAALGWGLLQNRGARNALPPKALTLGLAAMQQGNGVQLVWNGRSPDVAQAAEGRLSIVDGKLETETRLKTTELGDGTFRYLPFSASVRFRLDVLRTDGRWVSEAVAIMLPKASPPQLLPPAAVNPDLSAKPNQIPYRPPVVPPAVSKATQPERIRMPGSVPPAAPPAQVPHQAPSVTLPSQPALSAPLPAPPNNETSNNRPAPARVELPDTPTVSQSVRAPEVSPLLTAPPDLSPLPAAPAAEPPKVVVPKDAPSPAAEITPPVALQRPQPILPPSLRGMVTREIQIQVRLQINAAGKVINAEPVGGQGALAVSLGKIAAETARLWKFQAARQNNQPIPSVVDIQFKFGPGR